MTTPIYDFLCRYSQTDTSRLHMPGHKGQSFLGIEAMDITEISGADVLYHESGILRESQNNAAKLFGTAKTLYSTEGSTLSIRAILQLICQYAAANGTAPLVATPRSAHKAFWTGAALLDLAVDLISSDEQSGIFSGGISAEQVRCYFKGKSELPTAVYLTSPDYLGNLSEVEEIARICHEKGVLLAVDNAHGAYLNFLPENHHPIALGADLCADSAHKTLPVLTGGAYLHVSKTAPAFFASHAENALSIFASSSPNYLILASLDLANRYLSELSKETLSVLSQEIHLVKKRLQRKGFLVIGNEPLKITIATKACGYEGFEVFRFLHENGIEAEFCDSDYVTMMLTPQNKPNDWKRMCALLESLPIREPLLVFPPKIQAPPRPLSPREAILSPWESVPTEKSLGRICAAPTVNCPPAVPIVISGEEITQSAIEAFLYYGIDSVKVVL